ncbi:hypothetical protein FKV24_017920 [Lysobacter maris]|uniref:Uncharacterized protein n=1 Tax=Marilutibacter maris TaxID=1605891 RepID=A0A507ZSR7_9GAMM|nr:hypothetical protein [Lysobacter maris]KAB8163256.1 hypothetical protein FKV24_017920 [Lysobacter maris]
MLLHKTPKAHAALTGHSARLSTVERRALIISNGQRDLDEIVGLLGGDARAAVERLLREDYLVANRRPRSPLDAAASMPKGAPQAPARLPHDTPAPAFGATATPSPAAATQQSLRSAPRRSLAASKMYVIGLLQLLRNADAAALAATLQASRDPDGTVAGMLDALRHIHATCNPSYTHRVADRLTEILPESHLLALHAERARWSRA